MMPKWVFRLWAILLSVIVASRHVEEIIKPGAAWWWIAFSILAIAGIIHFAVSAWRRA